jgi:2-polyprenyl-6-methoxyphenol hydroxylase-like FAD-dependent oxidoreductase
VSATDERLREEHLPDERSREEHRFNGFGSTPVYERQFRDAGEGYDPERSRRRVARNRGLVAGNEVLVVGAGPTGLMLSCELALAGVKARLLEQRTDMPNITRAFAVHARTLELLDARGLADELVPRGVPVYQIAPAPGATLRLDREVPGRYPMLLIVPQSGTERVLQERAEQLGVQIVRGAEVVDLHQNGDGVSVELAGGDSLSADYAIGCDGAHSRVRRLVGVDFVGKQYETHILLADVALSRPPEDTLFGRTSPEGAVLVIPFGDGWFRAIAWDRLREQAPLTEPVSIAEMGDAFDRIAGDDFGMTEMRWSARFLSERRQAGRYRVGRVFLAGDAAHVHSPLGGQGMNTGIGDAMNLGWKLAAAMTGAAPDWLLDSYQDERHRVGASVLRLTDAFNQLVLGRSAVRRAFRAVALRAIVRFPRSRRIIAERLSGTGIAYPRTPDDHPMVGHRMPDIECGTARARGAQPTRVYELLREGRFVLLTAAELSIDRPEVLRAVDAAPQLPDAVLVRPDGYVAWASERLPHAADVSAAIDHWIARH